jgi:hypothetical protein
MGKKISLGALASSAFIWVASSIGANAATLLTFYGDWNSPPPGPQITYDAADDRGSLSCEFACEGLLSNLASGIYSQNVPNVSTASGWSVSAADLFYLANNSLATELAFVNAVVDPDFLTGTKTDGTGGSMIFTSMAEYILIKIGASPDMALIHNTSGVSQTYTYTAFSGEGAGLSHYTEFGGTEIPLPAAGFLLFAGLGALAALKRRKTA